MGELKSAAYVIAFCAILATWLIVVLSPSGMPKNPVACYVVEPTDAR